MVYRNAFQNSGDWRTFYSCSISILYHLQWYYMYSFVVIYFFCIFFLLYHLCHMYVYRTSNDMWRRRCAVTMTRCCCGRAFCGSSYMTTACALKQRCRPVWWAVSVGRWLLLPSSWSIYVRWLCMTFCWPTTFHLCFYFAIILNLGANDVNLQGAGGGVNDITWYSNFFMWLCYVFTVTFAVNCCDIIMYMCWQQFSEVPLSWCSFI